MTHSLAPDCSACFQCSLCERVACADNEVVLCAHGDEPCCDDCCFEYHGTSGVPHPVGGAECAEWAAEKAISQGDEA